jgi:DnaJ-class molecular chaperone
LKEVVLGGKISAPTPAGLVTMTVPKGSNTGSVLRLRGKGATRANGSRGDEYVSLKVVLPEKPDPELEEVVANWTAGRHHNPRSGMVK